MLQLVQLSKKTSLIETAGTTGLVLGVIVSYKVVNINSETAGFSLTALTHTGVLATYKFNSATRQGNLVTDTDKTSNATSQKAVVDAHYFAAKSMIISKMSMGEIHMMVWVARFLL